MGKAACLVCRRDDAKFLDKQERWQCNSVHAHRHFWEKVGNHDGGWAAPLEKRLPAVWAIVNDKNGISKSGVASCSRHHPENRLFYLSDSLGMSFKYKHRRKGKGFGGQSWAMAAKAKEPWKLTKPS